MKHIYLTMIALLAACGLRAQTLPTFSTDDSETWYVIQFCRGEAALTDMGEAKNLQTADVDKTSNAQLWKIVGTQDNCEIISKSGRHIYYNGSRYAASASKSGQLRLVATTNSTYAPAWEIQSVAGGAGNSMNQWGGSGSGRELGSYNAGDVNDPLLFVDPATLPETDPQPTKLAEFYTTADASYRPDNLLTLWYTTPVTKATVDDPWMEYALPIGNGQLGAMIYGGIRQDIVQFNEKTLWTGSSTLYNRDGGYQDFGALYITDLADRFSTAAAKGAKKYYRSLDLTTAVAAAQWLSPDQSVTFRREYIASYPDKVIAVHLSASEPGQLSHHFYLWNAHNVKATYADGEGTFSGKLTTVSFDARMKVIATGGTVTTDEKGVTVTGADEILVLLTGCTDYDPVAAGYVSGTDQIAARNAATIAAAAGKTWASLLADHEADYQPIFDRCRLALDGAAANMTTDKLVDTYAKLTTKTALTKSANARQLEQLYFHYGRYMLIASSRGIDLPNNLQGIWNHKNAAPWCSDIHANINIQMNYWPAEVTNLSDMHLPYLHYLYNMAVVQPQWQGYAKNWLGQTQGWACFTENNIFGCCTDWMAQQYPEAGAWSCDHLWQHYRYTLDTDFLEHTALPVMLSATRMWMERLVKGKDGLWECPNEWSPEHGPTENATAHAQQIVWNLFSTTLQAIDALGLERAGVSQTQYNQIKAKFDKLDDGLHTEPYEGTFGATFRGVKKGEDILREWKYTSFATGNNGEQNHRHMSHFMALYPFANLPASNPYYPAAIRSLWLRGLASTGWSMGWKVNLWARALDGDQCVEILKLAFKHSTSYGTDQSKGGVYYNLFDSHSPFQIDGNFGMTAGMAEMLLQSHTDTLQLLPALPYTWTSGAVRGLCAVGAFDVDMQWDNSELTSATVFSRKGQPCRLAYAGIGSATVKTADGDDVDVTVLSDDRIEFATEAGQRYVITPHSAETGVGAATARRNDRFAPAFDLSGRRVQDAQIGIHIQDGRKFAVH